MRSQFHFVTRWRLKASAEEVFAVLDQPLEYPRWWPSVYLGAKTDGGNSLNFTTRGVLPFTLAWQARKTEASGPGFLALEVTGDLKGRGIWSIVSDGEFADVTFDWKVSATRPILRRLSLFFRPLFEANHRWVMEQGRHSLELEIERSRARTVEEMSRIPDPPRVPPFLAGLRHAATGPA